MWTLISLLAVCLYITGTDGSTCAPRDYGHGSVVCVCNASYCDTIAPTLEKTLPPGKFLRYSSSKQGVRMRRSQGDFVRHLKNPVNNDTASFEVDLKTLFQEMLGFGGAVTDSTGINLASLSKKSRDMLLRSYFGRDGAGYSLVRVPMGGTDFSTRFYTYDDVANDTGLRKFKLSKEDYQYKIPVLLRAKALSARPLLMQACPWTAPEWMKYSNGTLGISRLRPDYYQLWADYFVKFLNKYMKAGIRFWGVSLQNEPSVGYLVNFGVNSMGWTPREQHQWLTRHLGPTLAKRGYGNLKVLAVEDNRGLLPTWAKETLVDEAARSYVSGFSVHWYTHAMTDPRVLDVTHNLFPDKFLLYTEASNAPSLNDRVVVKLGSWERAEAYATNIIQVCNHWATGWLDWNLALNLKGGPSWHGNTVDASIIVNATGDEFLKQPMFYAIAHFSKFVPKGSRRIALLCHDAKGIESVAFKTPSGSVVVVLLNRRDKEVHAVLKDREHGYLSLTLGPRSLNTLLYRLLSRPKPGPKPGH